jgi:hypothetical protein
VLVKANVGGSGAGIVRFDSASAIVGDAASRGELDLGPDGTALVQELAPLRGDAIMRVELLGGRVLYGIRVFPAEGSFNLCPADVCQTTGGQFHAAAGHRRRRRAHRLRRGAGRRRG